LNWEDKELVLRVLFAKMNGASGEAPKQHTLGAKNRTQEPNQAVFISEGAQMPTNGMPSLGHFEVSSSQANSYDDYGDGDDYGRSRDDYDRAGMYSAGSEGGQEANSIEITDDM
jgi:hypothetical protein